MCIGPESVVIKTSAWATYSIRAAREILPVLSSADAGTFISPLPINVTFKPSSERIEPSSAKKGHSFVDFEAKGWITACFTALFLSIFGNGR